MKFLLDVCVSSRSLADFLATTGHDVTSAAAIDPNASDEQLMELAHVEGRVLITGDKDFGEIVFVRQRPHGPIIQVFGLRVDEQVRAIDDFLRVRQDEVTGQVIFTLTRGRVRTRRND